MPTKKIVVNKLDLREGEELYMLVDAIRAALTQQGKKLNKSVWLQGIYNKYIIVKDPENNKLFKIDMTRASSGDIELGEAVEVKQTFAVVSQKMSLEKAVWSARFINTLPDSSFLYIESGGKKDEEGKTTPRSLRHFPVKDADGKVDLPHLRNALARIPQSSLPQAVKDKLTKLATKMMEDAKEQAQARRTKSVEDIPDDIWSESLNALVETLTSQDPIIIEVEEKMWDGIV